MTELRSRNHTEHLADAENIFWADAALDQSARRRRFEIDADLARDNFQQAVALHDAAPLLGEPGAGEDGDFAQVEIGELEGNVRHGRACTAALLNPSRATGL